MLTMKLKKNADKRVREENTRKSKNEMNELIKRVCGFDLNELHLDDSCTKEVLPPGHDIACDKSPDLCQSFQSRPFSLSICEVNGKSFMPVPCYVTKMYKQVNTLITCHVTVSILWDACFDRRTAQYSSAFDTRRF